MRNASFGLTRFGLTFGLTLALLILVAAAPALGGGGSAIARLRSFDEVPAVATPGGGTFHADISSDDTEIEYELSYSNIEGNVTQAHLHFAQRGVNGGIIIFLCSNLGNGPAGTQACPAGGTISGTITAADVLAASGQSFLAGDIFSVIRGIRAGVVYANVHTDQLPGGSIRGQLLFTPAD
jgi:hypothetical protein